MRWSVGIGLVLIGGAALGAGLHLRAEQRPRLHYADAGDPALIARGRTVYAAECAQCHGAHLEGQANWQVVGADGRVRAPPQDETGHSWMHDDETLFRFVKYSMADIAAPGYVSPMPAFEGKLSDRDISAALAFIKSNWPVGVRAYQALLNPDHRGMPEEAAGGNWRLPADCGVEPGSLVSTRPPPEPGQ